MYPLTKHKSKLPDPPPLLRLNVDISDIAPRTQQGHVAPTPVLQLRGCYVRGDDTTSNDLEGCIGQTELLAVHMARDGVCVWRCRDSRTAKSKGIKQFSI